MKTHSASLIVSSVAAGLMLAAAPAMSADYPGTDRAQANGQQATQQTREQKGSQDVRSQKAADKAWEQTHRASKIIGTNVQNPNGQKVGTVKDLVIDDPASGQITRVVVSVGGVSGLGDKLFAVPYNALQRDEAKNVLVLSSDSDLAHAFDENNWQALANQNRGTASTAATMSPPSASSTPTSASTSESGSTSASPGSAASAGVSPSASGSTAASSASGNGNATATTSSGDTSNTSASGPTATGSPQPGTSTPPSEPNGTAK
jgi:sporulation protein YlmC with PRC-barrel domain